jgi:hypothetical protein
MQSCLAILARLERLKGKANNIYLLVTLRSLPCGTFHLASTPSKLDRVKNAYTTKIYIDPFLFPSILLPPTDPARQFAAITQKPLIHDPAVVDGNDSHDKP